MSQDNILFDNLTNPSFGTCLQAMRLSLVEFSKIHTVDIFDNQVANAYETYLPMTLEWGDNHKISVNDLFATDFTEFHGDFDPATNLHKPKVFVIFGAQGSGKTSLVNYLNYQWIFHEAEDVLNIKDFHAAIVFEVDKVKTKEDIPNLESILNFEYFPKGTDDQAVLNGLVSSKILWLVDGFDGATDEAKEVVKEMVLKFPLSQVLITSRWTGIEEMNEFIGDLRKSQYVRSVTMRLSPLTGLNWKLMVPKIVAANTRKSELIEEISSQFISKIEKSIPASTQIFPFDLALSIKFWLQEKYDIS
ncbi:uncharacterized protein [Palaemon carinicauda]|uniref:uncharacterized protein n=1 Tax=Palaemon carinicauda TaxID=392227 RepID=UPI0035B6745E